MQLSGLGLAVKQTPLITIITCCFAVASLAQSDNDGATSVTVPGPAFVNTADLAVAAAEEVVIDVQSAFFSSRFQQGEIDGFRYVLFPDGFAKVYNNSDPQNVLVSIQCTYGVSCVIDEVDGSRTVVIATGSPKPDLGTMTEASDVANYLSNWVLAGSGTAPSELIAPPSGFDGELSQRDEPVLVVADEIEPVVEVATVVAPEPQGEEAVPLTASADFKNISENAEPQKIAATQDVDCSEQSQFVLTACADPAPLTVRPLQSLDSEVSIVPSPTLPQASTVATNEPEPLSFSEKYKLRCSLTGSANLNYENPENQTQRPGKPRVSLGCSASPTDNLSVRVALIGYVFSEQQEDFNPDFTYALTYRINNTVSLGYSNYSGRFSGVESGFYNALTDGDLRASFRLPKLNLPNDKSIACSASIGLPDPTDVSANLSCGYSVTSKLRIGATMLLYLPDAQEDFQPDYTYTASYRWEENWLISYSNYSNNRWPWNSSSNSGGGLDGGSVSVTYSLKF